MASPTESRSLAKSASALPVLPKTIDAARHQNTETSDQHGTSNASQLVAHYYSIRNTTSQSTQPPITEFQAFPSDNTYNVNSRQSKPLNPRATVFVPAMLERLYNQHREACLREKVSEIDMKDTHEMLLNGEPGQYDFERLGERLRVLRHEYMDAVSQRVNFEVAIEKNYGFAALGGISQKLSEDESKSIEIRGDERL
ncbi:MAG: hypothetical protein Q9195_006350 [Heterodermia aff. obscurata]